MSFEVISQDRHSQASIRPLSSCSYASATPAVPVVGSELGKAAAFYPIAFGQFEADAPPVPCAAFSLEAGDNLFVHPTTGTWRGGYLPAFLRRYPFSLMATDKEQTQFAVAINKESSFLDESGTEGQRLFTDDGERTEFFAETVDFLVKLQAETLRMIEIGRQLKELELLVPFRPKAAEDAPIAEERIFNGLWRLDEEKLNGLDDGNFLALRKSGALAVAYVHLATMGQWERLSALHRLQTHARAQGQNAPPLPGIDAEAEDWVISFDE